MKDTEKPVRREVFIVFEDACDYNIYGEPTDRKEISGCYFLEHEAKERVEELRKVGIYAEYEKHDVH